MRRFWNNIPFGREGYTNKVNFLTVSAWRLPEWFLSCYIQVCSTRFHHVSTKPPGCPLIDQIDHIITGRRHVLVFHTFSGSNVDPYHYLVSGKIRLRISASTLSAQLSDKLHRTKLNFDDISGLWAIIFHSNRKKRRCNLRQREPLSKTVRIKSFNVLLKTSSPVMPFIHAGHSNETSLWCGN